MTYIATDDDLPSIFWPDGPQRDARRVNDESWRGIALQVHFPYIKTRRQIAREQRALAADAKERQQPDRKIYVKLAKKQQMFQWLMSLEKTIPGMDRNEADFCSKLLVKFRRYSPARVKWITAKQYEWLKFIGTRYIHIPNPMAELEENIPGHMQ